MTEYKFDRGYFEGAGYGYPGLYTDFPVHHRTVDMVLQRKPESVLDLGGARGYIAKKLIDKGVNAWVMDIAEHCYHTRATNNFYLHSMYDAPYPINDKQFDLAISIAVLEHIPEDKVDIMIKEIARVSKRSMHGISYTSNLGDMDKTHITMRPREWWDRKFQENTAGTDHKYEIIEQKEVLSVPLIFPQFDGKTKYNIGSFINMFHHGWINVDRIALTDFARDNGYVFHYQDVVQLGLPAKESNSVDIYLAEHFLEHLTLVEAKAFLEQCHKTLKPNGVIRIAVPDVLQMVQEYLNGTIMRHKTVNVGVENAASNVEALFELIGKGHRMAFDASSLIKLMTDCGFKEIKQMQFGVSRSREIVNQTIDSYPELSLYIEGIK